MQRLEITGNTPEELYFNVVKTLSIFLGGKTTPVSPPQETAAASSSPELNVAATTAPLESSHTVVGKLKRGSKKTEAKVLNDEIPDLGTVAGTYKALDDTAPPLTLDGDIRPRLRAIQVACTARKLDMPATISYIQKLYGPFGIAKAEQLKPGQYVEFLEASEAYLTGEA